MSINTKCPVCDNSDVFRIDAGADIFRCGECETLLALKSNKRRNQLLALLVIGAIAIATLALVSVGFPLSASLFFGFAIISPIFYWAFWLGERKSLRVAQKT
jgi:uncharacterized protein (DUF983 family)